MRSLAVAGSAFESLVLSKLRSALTMLGIVIGVAAVVAMVAVANGASARIEGSVLALGSNLITVTPGALTDATLRGAGPQAQTLTYADMKALEERLGPTIVAIDAERQSGRWQVVAGTANWNAPVSGVTEQYPRIHDWALRSGVFFTQDDLARFGQVAVIGATTALDLYGTEESVGRSLQLRQSVGAGVRSLVFTVVGVLESKGSIFGSGRDDQILVPLTTAEHILSGGSDAVGSIIVKAASTRAIGSTVADVQEILAARHRTSDPESPDFTVTDQRDAIAAADRTTSTFALLLGAIGGISLLVGGIGIMNIMLVSVKERTHEIGIRKAVGARQSDILEQFLVEAMALTLGGGALGIGVGCAAAAIIGRAQTAVTPVVSPASVLIAAGVSTAVGLLFGLYPAVRAARLNPIDALRA